MNDDDVLARLGQVLRDVLGRPSLEVTRSTTADDVEGWDSLAHVNLLFAVEEEFGIRLSQAEMAHLADVGALVDAVTAHVGVKDG